MSQACLRMPLLQLENGIQHFSVWLQKQNNVKVYMIPHNAIPCNFSQSHFHIKSVKSHIRSVYPVANDYQRSKTLFDHTHNGSDDTCNFEKQLNDLLSKVRNLIMKGNKNNAIDLIQANYEAVKEQMEAGAKGIEQAAILDIVALGYIAVGDFKLVISVLEMLNEIVDSLNNNETLLDAVLVHMGSMYSTLERFDKSIDVYQRAIDVIEHKYGSTSSFLITPMLGIAKVLGGIGRVNKAVQFYRRAISILESSRGMESEDLVVPLFSLANLLLKEGRSIDAETSFVRILNIYTNLYGERDGRVGMAMHSVAHAKLARGKADEAIVLYKKALQVIKDSNYMALEDSALEKMRIDLAEILHAVGRGKEGRELLEECLLISEKYKGKENPSSVQHLINLANSYSRSKNYVEAERLLRKGLDIMVQAMGPDDQSITLPMLQLAVTLYHLKKDEEAEQLTLEALRIREKTFGKDTLPVGEALDCLVSIQTRMERDDTELLELLKRIVMIQEKAFGYESEEVMVTLKKIVFYLDKLGMRNDMCPLQRRLSSLQRKFKQQL